MNIITKEELKKSYLKQFEYLNNNSDVLRSSCIVFVYNSLDKTATNDLHISECVYDEEVALIKDAFHSFKRLSVLTYDSEDSFMAVAPHLKQKYENVYVYSMAQNLDGIGRRCLVPLLCEYYGFHNISSNSASSFLGGNKKLMHMILESHICLPHRLFLSTLDEASVKNFIDKHQQILIKPNSESASIGVSKVVYTDSLGDILKKIKQALDRFKSIMLEEFIVGDEVECVILPYNNDIYIGEPIKIIKKNEFLDYITVANDDYGFEFYQNQVNCKIQQQATQAYSLLNFDSVARFDFIVKDNKTYLFDITPNPTISTCSSSNLALQFLEDDRSIYKLLLLNKLFVPTLY